MSLGGGKSLREGLQSGRFPENQEVAMATLKADIYYDFR